MVATATPERRPILGADALAQPKSLDQLGLPSELARWEIPTDNPQTPEKIALGERLFFDGHLSADGTVACSTCHDPIRAFTEGQDDVDRYQRRPRPAQRADHSERTLEQDPVLGWKSKTLEDQVALPIVTPVEMGQLSLDVHHSRDRGIEEYRKSFQQVFGRKPNCPDLVRAIASYERMQVAFDASFDLFITRDNNTIDDSAKCGWELFNIKGSLQ